jgi:hypothetical protein
MSPRSNHLVPETFTLEENSTKHDRPAKQVVSRRELIRDVRGTIDPHIDLEWSRRREGAWIRASNQHVEV